MKSLFATAIALSLSFTALSAQALTDQANIVGQIDYAQPAPVIKVTEIIQIVDLMPTIGPTKRIPYFVFTFNISACRTVKPADFEANVQPVANSQVVQIVSSAVDCHGPARVQEVSVVIRNLNANHGVVIANPVSVEVMEVH